MDYDNKLYENLIDEDHDESAMSLEEQVRMYKLALTRISEANLCMIDNNYILEYTGANSQYRLLTHQLNKQSMKFYFTQYLKAWVTRNKEAALEALDEFEKFCAECRKIEKDIKPDKADTVVSQAVMALNTILAFSAYEQSDDPRWVKTANEASYALSASKYVLARDNTKDVNKAYNVFRNSFFETIEYYESYIKFKRMKVNKWKTKKKKKK